MEGEKYYLWTILILSAIIGVLAYRITCKRREDIIKVMVTRESLPAPAPNTTWIQGGACAMSDKTFGRVDGNFCQQVKAL